MVTIWTLLVACLACCLFLFVLDVLARRFPEASFGQWRSIFAITTVVFFLAVLVAKVEFDGAQSNKQVIVHLNAPDGSVYTRRAPADRADELLMREEGHYTILRGRVTTVSDLGAAGRTCIEGLHKEARCGFADSSLGLKEGDWAYFRAATFLVSSAPIKGKIFSHFGLSPIPAGSMNEAAEDGSFIPENDAKELAAGGQFRIVDQIDE